MERPILFNTEMVQAILAGRKTQTRRIVKPKGRFYRENGFVVIDKLSDTSLLSYSSFQISDGTEERSILIEKPCKIGDVLYVRETWGKLTECDVFPPYEPHEERFIYRADIGDPDHFQAKWHPSIHMPREAARIFLKVKNVRVEQLRDMSNSDLANEGFGDWTRFISLWNSTIKPSDCDIYEWNANPWVWVIELEKMEGYHAEK